MTDESHKGNRAPAGQRKPRKPRNNAARKAALSHQRENPGMKYTTARAHVAAPAGAAASSLGAWWDNPCYHRLLDACGLELSDRIQVLARWWHMREDPVEVDVPIGLEGTGGGDQPRPIVHLRFGSRSRHYAVIPHMPTGQIDFPGQEIVNALLTSVLASCDRELLTVWLIGRRHDLLGHDYCTALYADRKGLIASGPVDAIWAGLTRYWPDPYYTNRERGLLDWVNYDHLAAELDRRQAVLTASDAADHESWWAKRTAGDTTLPHLLVVTSHPHRERDREILRRTLADGPALGVHVLVVADSISGEFWPPLSQWCDMVLTQPGVTAEQVAVLADADADPGSHLVIRPAADDDGAAQVGEYEPFIDTGNGLWLPVYGANQLHTGLPVISLSISGGPVPVHLAAARHLLGPTATEIVAKLTNDSQALKALAELLAANRPVTAADIIPRVEGGPQRVALTDVAIVGHPDDTAAVLADLLAQLPSETAKSTTTVEDRGVRTTTVPAPVPAPTADYALLPPGSHRIIEARTVENLPALSVVAYRIEVSAGGEKLAVHHPEDDPRERRVDVFMEMNGPLMGIRGPLSGL